MFDVKKFNLRKLNELQVMKEYQTKISNTFSALENLRDSEEINRAWKIIKRKYKNFSKRESRSERIWYPHDTGKANKLIKVGELYFCLAFM
jgi:hypothetical protein